MSRILWPTKKHPEPNLLGRLGRVIHWALTSISILFLIMAYFDFITARHLEDSTGILLSDGSLSPDDPREVRALHWELAIRWLLYAVGAFLGGRVARYVLSNE